MSARIGDRRRAHARGFTLIETLVAATIMFTGAVVMISVLPNLIAASSKRTSRDNAYIFAQTISDSLLSTPWSQIQPSASGNFQTLLPAATDTAYYTWSYTSSVVDSGLLKKVNLGVHWSGGSDSYSLYIADLRND